MNGRERTYFLFDAIGPDQLAFWDGYNLPRVFVGEEWLVEYDHKFAHESTPLTDAEFQKRLAESNAPLPPGLRDIDLAAGVAP